MKTLEELKRRLASYKEGLSPMPGYHELIELVTPTEQVDIGDMLHYLWSISDNLRNFESNYVLNCWVESDNGQKLSTLNSRKREYIHNLYERIVNGY